MNQKDMVSQQQLRRLYQMSITGVFSGDLLDEIVSKMRWILGQMKSTKGSQELLKILTDAKTDNVKMIAIDMVMHKAHTSGFYTQHLIHGKNKIKNMRRIINEKTRCNNRCYWNVGQFCI